MTIVNHIKSGILSRRTMLVTVLSGFGAALWASLPSSAPIDGAHAAFLELSLRLTARPHLDQDLGERLHRALVSSHPNFDSKIALSAAFARKHPMDDGTTLITSLGGPRSPLGSALRAITSAWYTGVVGTGTGARLIAYPDALMFSVVEDVLTAPSFSRGGPNYWVTPPPAG